jgi:hypothetical protein
MPDDKLRRLSAETEIAHDDILTLYNAAFDRNETEYNAVQAIEVTALIEMEIVRRWKKEVEDYERTHEQL